LTDQENDWKKEAFLSIEERFKDITYMQGKDKKPVTDFDSYGEYLQTTSDFDVQEYLDLTNTLEVLTDDEEQQAFEKLKKYLYHIYGFVENEEQLDEKKIVQRIVDIMTVKCQEN
jgi:hypothetical protein